MHSHNTTGAPSASASAEAAGTKVKHNPDLMFSVAWQAWIDAKRSYRASADGNPGEQDEYGYTVEHNRLLAQIDIAEIAIKGAHASTVDGIIPKLLLALHHASEMADAEEALITGELQPVFDLHDELPWADQLIISAIRDLKKLGEACHG